MSQKKPSVRVQHVVKKPKIRHALSGGSYDGEHLAFKVANRDPAYHYVWANRGGDHGVEAYGYLGYEECLENGQPGACRPAAGKTELNAPHVRRDMVLMRIPKQSGDDRMDHEFLVQHGADGQSGLGRVRLIEQQIVNGGDDEDPSRGKNPKYMRFKRETEGFPRQEA